MFFDQRRAELLGFKRTDLLVHGADRDALLVIEHRRVDGARQMVDRAFARAARIDDGVELSSWDST
jgi:hypothetical protein